MAHVPYPTVSDAMPCLMDAIAIVRGGWSQVVAHKVEMGEHIWCIQGAIQSVVLGSSDGPFAVDAAAEADLGDKLEEFATEFQACCPDLVSAAALSEVKGSFSADSNGLRKIDWAKWIQFFVTTILPIILAA